MSMSRLVPVLLLWVAVIVGSVGVVMGAEPRGIDGTESERLARAYLWEHAADYGLRASDVAGLRLDVNHAIGNGAYVVKFTQTHNGIAIHGAELNVTLLRDGTVLDVGNRAIPHPTTTSITPVLTQQEAIARAADAFGLRYTAETVTRQETIGGTARELRFSGGDLSLEPIPVNLVYQPLDDGTLRLAWELNIYTQDAQHWWEARVDALTGAVLDTDDWVIHDDWSSLAAANTPPMSSGAASFAVQMVSPRMLAFVGTYRVYALPTESPTHSDPPSPADGRDLAANPDLPTASPFGWHDTDGIAGAEFTRTQGNNSHSYTDTDSNNIPDAGSDPDGGAGLLFDFPIDLTQPPAAYRPASVTNLFYWTNVVHDIAHQYGFNEAARNMQENNYGNGGSGSDGLIAEAQEGIGTNGGNIGVPPDGQNPRMQMFVWTFTTPNRDGALDASIVVHEYGHAISIRSVGAGTGCIGNPEGMGEGWSDWQAVMLTMRPDDTGATPRGVGTYVTGQSPTDTGIRPAPYSTDFSVNDYTYADLPGNGGAHGVGFIWNTMLWELNWELINAYGFNPDLYGTPDSGGNNLAYQLVQTGLQLTPCAPGMVDGRNAILNAEVVHTGGVNRCRIWSAFARRGLGFSASQGSSNSTTDGTAAFDLPSDCPGATPTATVTTPPSTVTATPTLTATPTQTVVTSTPTPTTTATPTCCTPVPSSPTPTSTGTLTPVTSTPTATPTVPTVTPTIPTITPGASTATPTVATATPEIPTATPSSPTATPFVPTATVTPSTTPLASPTATATPVIPSVTVTPTAERRLFLPVIRR